MAERAYGPNVVRRIRYADPDQETGTNDAFITRVPRRALHSPVPRALSLKGLILRMCLTILEVMTPLTPTPL